MAWRRQDPHLGGSHLAGASLRRQRREESLGARAAPWGESFPAQTRLLARGLAWRCYCTQLRPNTARLRSEFPGGGLTLFVATWLPTSRRRLRLGEGDARLRCTGPHSAWPLDKALARRLVLNSAVNANAQTRLATGTPSGKSLPRLRDSKSPRPGKARLGGVTGLRWYVRYRLFAGATAFASSA